LPFLPSFLFFLAHNPAMALHRLAGLFLRHQLGGGGALALTTPCGAAAALVGVHGGHGWLHHMIRDGLWGLKEGGMGHGAWRACVRACMHACVRACLCVCVPAHVHVCFRVCMPVRACVRDCACVRACVRVCLYMRSPRSPHPFFPSSTPLPQQQHGQIQWQQHLTQQQQQQQQQRGMATKKAGGTARQKPDSKSRNLGVKLLHDQVAFPGQIMVRQRGTKYHPGYNVGLGKDHTIFATGVGRVQFSRETVQWLGGRTRERTVVSVVPLNGDWGPDYKELEARLVARRNALKRGMVQVRVACVCLVWGDAGRRQALHAGL